MASPNNYMPNLVNSVLNTDIKKCLQIRLYLCIKVAPYSYNVSVHVLFEGLLFLFCESCGVET